LFFCFKTVFLPISRYVAQAVSHSISKRQAALVQKTAHLALNNIDTNATLKAGQKIKVPVDGNTVKSPSQNTVYTDPKGKNDVGKIDTVTVWPLASPFVKNINGKVSGVELTGKSNEPVKAVHSGTVMYTGLYRGFGEVVFIQSKTGLIYSYSGLGSVKVTKGAYVTAGDEIGKTGKISTPTVFKFSFPIPINPYPIKLHKFTH